MPSMFNAHDADSYEQMMGRWSRRLAPLFIEHAGAAAGERLLEVGCGTGSLTFTLARTVPFRELTAIDYADVYVTAARARNRDPRVRIEQGDAAALPFPDAHFDRALSLLVLHFVADPAGAVAEMRRVTRPGGVVAAAVWDSGGGMIALRMFWDTAAMLDAAAVDRRGRAMSNAVVAPGGLARLFRAAGLADVDERALLIRMDHTGFADYWGPILRGEGPMGGYVAGLGEAERARLEGHLRAAYLAGAPDGPRSYAAVAWSCRGVVPAS
ncbi:MAG TPA: class I SAM-dependent methyltransferase [Methylomirabilota bacterium]|nr:class I SAM-dependent methyltransferase [Methylomirabilota bacterium]